MNLKSGCIFWTRTEAAPVIQTPLSDDLTCAVAVIGGGITGALVSYYLTSVGVSVALVDRREFAQGSTAASTGLLQYEIDTSLVELTQKLGKSHAIGAYLACLRSLDTFDQLRHDLGDDCELTPKTSLYCASTERDMREVQLEFEARKSIGIAVEYLNQGAIRERFSFSRPAAIYSKSAMQVNPFRFTQALLRRSIERGLAAFPLTRVTEYIADDNGVTLRTEHGPRLRAKYVVFATGYETPRVVGKELTKLKSTYALASQPLSSFTGWDEQCLIWESARPYFYLRTTADGRAMIGGCDEDFVDTARRDKLLPAKQQELTDRFAAMFPSIDMHSDCCWAGTFAETDDGLPLIGACKYFPRGYFALGYGGNGITFSLIAAEIIRDLYVGKPNENASLFRFDR